MAVEPRAPVSLDAAHLAELRPRHPGRDFELEFVEEASAHQRFEFRFQTYSDQQGDFKTVTGTYYRTRRAPPGARPPLIVVSPILAGPVDDYLASRFLSWQATKAGLSTFFLHQETVILRPERDAVGLEAFLRESVRDNIKALDLFVELPEVDPSRLGSIGVSLGAIRGVVLLACEKRLRASVLALAGADLASMVRTSEESLVLRYLGGRAAREGMSREEVAAEIGRWLVSDPLHLAPAVETERVLLVLGRFDTHVPYENGLLLRRTLGEPETYILPWGHYSSVLAAPWAAATAIRWLAARLEPPSPAARLGES